jgi:predicted short-subunit dehydrogenase-like oxidoreductase (DUF2520 family)
MPTKKSRKEKPTVSIIGVGRLGTAIAIALAESAYRIISLVGRRRQQVLKAATVIDVSCEILVAKDLGNYRPAEVVIIAVPDDRIPQIAQNLAQIRLPKGLTPTVLHTSGALSSTIFENLADGGWRAGSIHPLVSVSDPRAGVNAFRKSFWCVEGDPVALRVARQLVRDFGGRTFSIDRKDKPLYHAAAVMSSGNVMALFDVAVRMLEKCGLSRSEAQKVLLPLLQSTTNNLFQFDPKQAMTGPFSRGDLETVKRHIKALIEKNLTEALEIYRILGKHSLEMTTNKAPYEVVQEIQKNLRYRGSHRRT